MSPARPDRCGSDAAPVFAALGDPTRLSLLIKLSDGRQRSIAALSADTDLSRQAITKHLHVLEGAGLVKSIRVGRESRFAYCPAPVNDAKSFLQDISAQWGEALGRLQELVEQDDRRSR